MDMMVNKSPLSQPPLRTVTPSKLTTPIASLPKTKTVNKVRLYRCVFVKLNLSQTPEIIRTPTASAIIMLHQTMYIVVKAFAAG